MRFRDKVALITGGASGIGRVTALRMAQEGANVVISDLSGDKLHDIARETGGIFVCGDVSKSRDVGRMVTAAVENFGRLDILVNSAGISHIVPALELTEEDWDRMICH